jgi:hypothetical protein
MFKQEHRLHVSFSKKVVFSHTSTKNNQLTKSEVLRWDASRLEIETRNPQIFLQSRSASLSFTQVHWAF